MKQIITVKQAFYLCFIFYLQMASLELVDLKKLIVASKKSILIIFHRNYRTSKI